MSAPADTKALAGEEAVEPIERLTVLYDERCRFCLRCRDWLLGQACLVPLELLPAGFPAARKRYPAAAPWLGRELVVVDQAGRAWIGPDAYVMCLWATRRYRGWAHRLSGPLLAPIAARILGLVSSRRRGGRAAGPEGEHCSWCDATDTFGEAR